MNEMELGGDAPFGEACAYAESGYGYTHSDEPEEEYYDPQPEEPQVFTQYEVVPQAEGFRVFAVTNDDMDLGYPTQTAHWDLSFDSLADVKKHVGVSRYGWNGCRVSVTMNGRAIDTLTDYDIL